MKPYDKLLQVRLKKSDLDLLDALVALDFADNRSAVVRRLIREATAPNSDN